MIENSSSKEELGDNSEYRSGIFFGWLQVSILVASQVMQVALVLAIVKAEDSLGTLPWVGLVGFLLMTSILIYNFQSQQRDTAVFRSVLESNKEVNKLALKAVEEARKRGRS